jgi:hypothetical protein
MSSAASLLPRDLWRDGQGARLSAEDNRLTRHIQHSKNYIGLGSIADLLAHLTPTLLILIRQRETTAQGGEMKSNSASNSTRGAAGRGSSVSLSPSCFSSCSDSRHDDSATGERTQGVVRSRLGHLLRLFGCSRVAEEVHDRVRAAWVESQAAREVVDGGRGVTAFKLGDLDRCARRDRPEGCRKRSERGFSSTSFFQILSPPEYCLIACQRRGFAEKCLPAAEH